jgi:pantetheine-phosphate adenylyltransferase
MRALYALSGDPPTNGHAWVINEIAKIADEIHIALAANPEKKYMFTEESRVVMLRAITSHIKDKRIAIHDLRNQFLVHFAKEVGATHLVRGIRSVKDYEYERTMAHVNSKLEPSVTTWFLFPPPELEAVSSSFIKGLVGLQGWETVAAQYVHPYVLKKLIETLQDMPK